MLLPAAWRSRWWWWALPLLFCILNGVFLWLHRTASNSGFRQIQDELAREEVELEDLEGVRDRLAGMLMTAERNRAGVTNLYEDRLATEEARLTSLILEVKRLARQAGLEPPNLTYGEVKIEEFGLVRKSIVFGVRGNYAQIRQLVNLLELSDLFLILDEIRLRESDGSRLNIDLRISTLFAVPGELDTSAAGAGGQP